MSSEKKLKQVELDYYARLILYFLAKTSEIVNQRQLADKIGIVPSTLKPRIKVLKSYGFISIIPKGNQNVVIISKDGKKEITEWQESIAGKRLSTEFDKKLNFSED